MLLYLLLDVDLDVVSCGLVVHLLYLEKKLRLQGLAASAPLLVRLQVGEVQAVAGVIESIVIKFLI